MVTSCGMAPSSRRIERIYQNERNQLLLFVISIQPNTGDVEHWQSSGRHLFDLIEEFYEVGPVVTLVEGDERL